MNKSDFWSVELKPIGKTYKDYLETIDFPYKYLFAYLYIGKRVNDGLYKIPLTISNFIRDIGFVISITVMIFSSLIIPIINPEYIFPSLISLIFIFCFIYLIDEKNKLAFGSTAQAEKMCNEHFRKETTGDYDNIFSEHRFNWLSGRYYIENGSTINKNIVVAVIFPLFLMIFTGMLIFFGIDPGALGVYIFSTYYFEILVIIKLRNILITRKYRYLLTNAPRELINYSDQAIDKVLGNYNPLSIKTLIKQAFIDLLTSGPWPP